ncbi:large subunit ribosomal protein L6 [Dethiosulfatibacter aminovorans DSM 17477]|uniref:Large ribosomal subunit protein uL6 n=1 Tax=Dethiosulfatibacter aminovorans DSM 17477 TaxID=1121476 RepID=A0A1M6L5T2_9FIRM|nr:50S ribosomal protein L6 [Dethiosulfatibacter aminovorans]SHJ66545.1 large subunit ribosomal protein L6 [Dethiosulfatibacter aminovorans DSM 17477]
MSRIGVKPIEIPAGVEVKISDNNFAEVKGPKGTLTEQLPRDMQIDINDNVIEVKRPTENKKHKSLHGLTRTLISNMVVGVTEGYAKKLEIVGVGYRAKKEGKKLVMNLGFSHQVIMEDPDGIETAVEGQNKITVSGINKQQVGNYAAVIRDWRKPEPYKGKGIKYENEYIRRKAGKTGK